MLYGLDPRDFVPEITPVRLSEALIRELGYLRDEIRSNPDSIWQDRQSYRAYAVLTVCRILYSQATGKVAPKPVAAAWVRENVSCEPDLIQLIGAAETVREKTSTADLPIKSVDRFVAHAERTLGA